MPGYKNTKNMFEQNIGARQKENQMLKEPELDKEPACHRMKTKIEQNKNCSTKPSLSENKRDLRSLSSNKAVWQTKTNYLR